MLFYSQQYPCNSISNHVLLQKHKGCWWGSSLSDYIVLNHGAKWSRRANNSVLCSKEPKERIKEMFTKAELSVSSYDTAWVAMVPSLNSPQFPCFPKCLNWLLENQLPDGSWGLPHSHPLLIKDALSSTLASILALRRWNIGETHVRRGLHFIESNFAFAIDEKQHSPIGFDLIFPSMIESAKALGLNIPLTETKTIDAILQNRDFELKRGSEYNTEGRNIYLSYVAEGLGDSQNWENVMKYQRKNGSLFNSPSTTAAVLLHLHDVNCLSYLNSLLEKFGNAVPTTYPLDIYIHLSLVDSLEKLGIDRHFSNEIKNVMDKTYRCWLEMDEEILLETTTRALAYRLLCMHGYAISSDALAQFDEAHFSNTLDGYLKDMGTILELYKASQIMINQDKTILEKLNSWSSHFLKQKSLKISTNADGFYKHTIKEVDYALNFPYYANLERLENRRTIEHYDTDNLRILKTSYRSLNVNNKDLLELAVEDFNICQTIHRKELQQLERWVEATKLDKLKFARQKLTYSYFSAAATIFSPELSDARISWTKNSVLATVIDDFFDIGGSVEEIENLVKLAEKWDGISSTDFHSEKVEIIFSALQNTTNEFGVKAYEWQGRNVTSHLIEIWLTLLRSMQREAEWRRKNLIPKMDEYMEIAYITNALGVIIIPTLYFVGPRVSEEIVRDPEYQNLFKLVSFCGRLLNDIQGYKRESNEGKLNGVTLTMIHSGGVITEEEAVRQIRGVVDSSRKELQRIVLQTKGSVVPRACKDLFWKMSKVVHLFYRRNDGFTCPQEMISFVNAVIHEPLINE